MAKRQMCAVLIEQSGEYESYREAIVRVYADEVEANGEAGRRNVLAARFGERWARHNETDPSSDDPDFDLKYEVFSKRGAALERTRTRQLGSADFDGRFVTMAVPFISAHAEGEGNG